MPSPNPKTSKRKTKAWNKNYKNITMALWNPWGLCNERFNYCKDHLNYDVLGLPELHNAQNRKLWHNKRWITSDEAKTDDKTVR